MKVIIYTILYCFLYELEILNHVLIQNIFIPFTFLSTFAYQ